MGKKGCELSKNLRQEMVLNMMERFGRGDGLTTRQVHSMLSNAKIETSFRTTLRDLEELSSHYPIGESSNFGDRRWIWTRCSSEVQSISEFRLRLIESLVDYLNTIEMKTS